MRKTTDRSWLLFPVLGTLVLTVSSCAPDDAVRTLPEASDPELEFQQQLDALRFGVEYIAESRGDRNVLLAVGKPGANVLRDQGRNAEDVIGRLADELGPRFERRVGDDATPSCPEESRVTCRDTEVVPVYYPTLVHFSGDRATVRVKAMLVKSTHPSSYPDVEVYLERTSDGWAVVNSAAEAS